MCSRIWLSKAAGRSMPANPCSKATLHTAGRDLPDVCQVRVQASHAEAVFSDLLRQGLGGDVEHAVGHAGCPAAHRAHAHTGEDVHIVALTGHEESAGAGNLVVGLESAKTMGRSQ